MPLRITAAGLVPVAVPASQDVVAPGGDQLAEFDQPTELHQVDDASAFQDLTGHDPIVRELGEQLRLRGMKT